MAQRQMETTVTEDKNNRLVSVTVEHEDWQSFSRAVRPRARKEFRSWVRENIVFGALAEASTSLAYHTVRDEPTRCISVFTFSY